MIFSKSNRPEVNCFFLVACDAKNAVGRAEAD